MNETWVQFVETGILLCYECGRYGVNEFTIAAQTTHGNLLQCSDYNLRLESSWWDKLKYEYQINITSIYELRFV